LPAIIAQPAAFAVVCRLWLLVASIGAFIPLMLGRETVGQLEVVTETAAEFASADEKAAALHGAAVDGGVRRHDCAGRDAASGGDGRWREVTIGLPAATGASRKSPRATTR
jgi:hypothetical protein